MNGIARRFSHGSGEKPLEMQPMRALNRLFAHCLAVVLALTLSIQPALAQSILRDAETEILLHDMATPLIRAADP